MILASQGMCNLPDVNLTMCNILVQYPYVSIFYSIMFSNNSNKCMLNTFTKFSFGGLY